MFLDYYEILGIDVHASSGDVKESFRRQAFKWHPDRNLGWDTTVIMQQINEAYLILKDPEARELYDKEYSRFKYYQQQQNNVSNQGRSGAQVKDHSARNNEESTHEREYSYSDYIVSDDVLKKWMENARRQAVELAVKTLEEFGEISAVGIKAMSEQALSGLGYYVVVSVLMSIMFYSCAK